VVQSKCAFHFAWVFHFSQIFHFPYDFTFITYFFRLFFEGLSNIFCDPAIVVILCCFLPGREIDAIARRPLWQVGWTYEHGTGHGIGMFLNVHEGLKLTMKNNYNNLKNINKKLKIKCK